MVCISKYQVPLTTFASSVLLNCSHFVIVNITSCCFGLELSLNLSLNIRFI